MLEAIELGLNEFGFYAEHDEDMCDGYLHYKMRHYPGGLSCGDVVIYVCGPYVNIYSIVTGGRSLAKLDTIFDLGDPELFENLRAELHRRGAISIPTIIK